MQVRHQTLRVLADVSVQALTYRTWPVVTRPLIAVSVNEATTLTEMSAWVSAAASLSLSI